MRPVVQLLDLRKMRVREAFVMAEVEIGFGAVVGNENFAVLKRRHRAGIDVEVRIEFDQSHVQAARFEQTRQSKTLPGLCQGWKPRHPLRKYI